ncbi:MAG: DUF2784 domain-containing protein [bacterium]|nr:DUF2784 domain-containing protein [bacterium]
MLTRFFADVVLLIHAAFIAFAVVGGLLTLRWPRVAWIHLPAAAWAATVVTMGWICPLTPLENVLRRAAGEAGYSGGFIEHYVVPLVYPAGLTREVQVLLGAMVVAVNLAIYATRGLRAKRRARAGRS